MDAIFILITSAVVIVPVWFIGFCMGQSRMRKKGKLKLLATLIEARNINGDTGRQRRRMDGWLTGKIRPLHREEMTGEL